MSDSSSEVTAAALAALHDVVSLVYLDASHPDHPMLERAIHGWLLNAVIHHLFIEKKPVILIIITYYNCLLRNM